MADMNPDMTEHGFKAGVEWTVDVRANPLDSDNHGSCGSGAAHNLLEALASAQTSLAYYQGLGYTPIIESVSAWCVHCGGARRIRKARSYQTCPSCKGQGYLTWTTALEALRATAREVIAFGLHGQGQTIDEGRKVAALR